MGECMAITKEILKQYIDLLKEQEEVKQRIEKTEKQLQKIEAEGNVIDKVRGGDGGIQNFKIEGFPYPAYSKKKTLLYVRRNQLEQLEIKIIATINEIEKFIETIDDSHVRRIITLRIVDGLSWEMVAKEIGGGNSEDSVKKIFYRYMERV